MVVELGYLTLPVKDVSRAAKFYGTLFGWTFVMQGLQGAHVNNTKFPLGLIGKGPAHARFVFFRVEDIVAAKAKLVSLGGSVTEESENPSGLNAVCVDDQGTEFSLWQPAPGF
jgi:predicted enzyme related to lactoylglutathione lyase